MELPSTVGRVSIAKCAALLSAAGDQIDRSALSRYCDDHQLKLGKVGREVLVDFEAVQAHRRENYTRQVMSGRELEPAGMASAPPASATGAAAPASAPVVAIPGVDDPQRDLKRLELRRKLREEALEEGHLTDTAEVDAGMAEAVVTLRAAFAAVRADEAERLAAQLQLPSEKVRALRLGLKRYERVGQERFAASLAKLMAEAGQPVSAARDRLDLLAAHAMRLRGRTPQAEVAA